MVITDDKGLCCRRQRWIFSGFGGKRLIFNARSESALEKRMFRESVEHRRTVVPATWFYEWNKKKEKNLLPERPANESMKPVHNRMPLLLERRTDFEQMSLFLVENSR